MNRVTQVAASVAVALGLVACSPADEVADQPAQTAESQAEQESMAEQTTTSEGFHSGLMLDNFDFSVRPQDDLFMFVNGTWYDETEIPSDMSSYGSFRILQEENEKRLRGIIEDATEAPAEQGSNPQKIGDFYASFMDQERIEELGLSPLEDQLEKIRAAGNHTEITELMAELRPYGVSGPFGFYVFADAGNPDYNALYLNQGGLGLPDRDYYFREGEDAENIRTAYLEYLTDMLEMSGHDHPADAAERIYALEESLAEHHWTRAESRDAQATYNKKSKEEVAELLGSFDYHTYAELTGIDVSEEPIVRMPSYFEALGDIYGETDAETWRDYLEIRLVSNFASRLSSDFSDRQFDFYERTLQGTPEQRERWKRGVSAVNSALGEALGEEYVARYFPPEARERMEELIDNLLIAFEESIKELEWMTDETKEKALEKLSKFTPKIGYPNQWQDYSDLEVVADDLIGNTMRAAEFSYYDNINDIGEPVDPEEWGMTPQTVNAYYSPTANEIVFPAGILQPPFFDMEADDAVNYGGIGAVIGHEIGHGFDDQGSRYDGDGNLRNWWTEEDREEFERRTQIMVEQYSEFEPLEGHHVDGEVSLGENIGDHVGLVSAFRAYQESLDGEDSPELDGFTGEQRFFLSWAQIWRMKMRDDAMREQLSRGPHAPAKYRALGAPRNVPAFYEAFEVEEGDEMYLPEDERAYIW